MKTKIRLLFLVGLFSIQSYAQESFLQLDSVVLVQQDINLTKYGYNFEDTDSINLLISSNQLIKVRSITVVAKGSNYPSLSNGNAIDTYNSLYDASVSLGGITMFSKEDFTQISRSGQLGKIRIYPDILIPGRQFSGSLFLVSRIFLYNYSGNHNESYEVISELVYYSLE